MEFVSGDCNGQSNTLFSCFHIGQRLQFWAIVLLQ